MENREALLRIVIYLIYAYIWRQVINVNPEGLGQQTMKNYFLIPSNHIFQVFFLLYHLIWTKTLDHTSWHCSILPWVTEAQVTWRGNSHYPSPKPSPQHCWASQALNIPLHCWRDETITPTAFSGDSTVLSYSKPTMQDLWWVYFEIKSFCCVSHESYYRAFCAKLRKDSMLVL
jgi:hypothetical protein